MRLILLLCGLQALASASQHRQVFEIPSAIQNETSIAQFTSTSTPLDAPKAHPINGSAFDWWYFDVVSSDPGSLASVVVTFFASSQPAFPLLHASNNVLPVRLWVSFPNGTLAQAEAFASSATVSTEGDNSSGDWHGTGFKWTKVSSTYTIEVDAPSVGIKGSIVFKSTAPAHLPCGAVVDGGTLQVGPHIGWANAVPDAASTVNLEINGTALVFEGSGYHDKNWSDQPFTTHVASWYWGHGRLGPFTLVWFDMLDLNGVEHVSAYLAKDNQIVTASCASQSISVRPTGANNASFYPPVLSTPNPTGYHISLDLGNKTRMEVDVNVLVNLNEFNPAYARVVGNMSARVVVPPGARGKTQADLQGMALFEQFKLIK
ncbi:hypothetical protein R3P38DRAFT_1369637 [Favolaschia claudopus]|uniref:Hydroxyneurosporene synthase n=1 Tax=Favolaschia claudopus TaxID=2862362 RepID=A0AAW0DW15_9AGAR